MHTAVVQFRIGERLAYKLLCYVRYFSFILLRTHDKAVCWLRPAGFVLSPCGMAWFCRYLGSGKNFEKQDSRQL
jgi:hypothetical protein